MGKVGHRSDLWSSCKNSKSLYTQTSCQPERCHRTRGWTPDRDLWELRWKRTNLTNSTNYSSFLQNRHGRIINLRRLEKPRALQWWNSGGLSACHKTSRLSDLKSQTQTQNWSETPKILCATMITSYHVTSCPRKRVQDFGAPFWLHSATRVEDE